MPELGEGLGDCSSWLFLLSLTSFPPPPRALSGSEFKIDASYLSPNVNMASRLEAATKQVGH
jgi:hypothetical protein